MKRKTYKAIFVGSKKDETLAHMFAIVGFDSLIVETDADVLDALGRIIERHGDDYALVVMHERFVRATRLVRENIREASETLPAFLFIPDVREPKYEQLEEIRELLKRALGVSPELLGK